MRKEHGHLRAALAEFLNGNCGRRQASFWFCNCAIDCPWVYDAGIGWPSSFPSSGLFASNVSKCDGPPDMYK